MKKSLIFSVVLVLMLVSVLTGCAGNKTETAAAVTTEVPAVVAATEAPAAAATTEAPKLKVAFIANQRFGDNGPMDQMSQGADQAAKEFNVEVKKVESINAAGYEDDIRAMSQEGYGLIITTFTMADPMITISQEYPKTLYAGIYEDVNVEGQPKYANIWGTSFRGGATFYINGYIAGKITKTGKIGLVVGAEEAGPNSEANAFMEGVKASNPNAEVQFSFVGSYEDPAKAKEIATAMIAKGVDVIQGDAGSTDTGTIEAAKENGSVVFLGCVTDYHDSYNNVAGTIKMGFDSTVYDAIKSAVQGNFAGGTNGIRDITNNGYYVDWAEFDRFISENNDYGPALKAVLDDAKALEAKFKDGSLAQPYDTVTPSWDRIKSEK